MTIKAFAFSAQQHVAERFGISLQRSHIYESLAAAFGFASYASLCVDSVFDAGAPGRPDATQTIDSVARRLAQLGVSDVLGRPVASELVAMASDQRLRVVGIDDIINSLLPDRIAPRARNDIDEDTDRELDDAPTEDASHLFVDWEVSDFLSSGLEEAAKRGNPKAHYALALIHKADEDIPVGSSYWRDRQLQGDQLSDVQLAWASAHQIAEQHEETLLHHLREAARLGYSDACVDAAEEFEDPAFLKMMVGAPVRDPARASEVAAELGQIDQARHWCDTAAQGGDIEAIRRMIESFDREDSLRCWTWLHFARLLGTDLTQDEYRLVNEDGSDYDDDVGGPGYPVGVDGVDLANLDEQQDAHARREASVMAERLQKGGGMTS